MKSMLKLIKVVLPLLMIACFAPVLKAEDDYYVITISGGLHGTASNEEIHWPKNETKAFPLGDYYDSVTVNANEANKYDKKGFHKSGIEGVITGAEVITKDTIYVMSYKVPGDRVEYYAEYYLDGQLVETDTYFGSVGDKPVVSYKYFEGYEPNTYNITGTLKPNSADNRFQFYYLPVGAGGGEGGTIIRYVDEGGVITYVTVPGGGGAGAGGGAVAPAGGGGAAPAGGGAGPAVVPDDQTPAAGPADIIDIDEPDTPAGNFSPAPTATATTIPEPGTPGGGLSNAWKIALATGGGIGLLLLLLLLLRRKDNAE